MAGLRTGDALDLSEYWGYVDLSNTTTGFLINIIFFDFCLEDMVATIRTSWNLTNDFYNAWVEPADTTVDFTIIGNRYFGSNTLRGAEGDDIVKSLAPLCTYIYGNGGNDTIIGSDAIRCSYLDGGQGNDSIVGGNRRDSIFGGSGNDTIIANGGNDEIFDYGGAASISGGIGNDTITFQGIAGRIAGGNGNDTINATNMAPWASALLTINPGTGDDTVTMAGSRIIIEDNLGSNLYTYADFHSNFTIEYDSGVHPV